MCFQHGGTLEWRKCKDDKRFIEVRKVKETRKKDDDSQSHVSYGIWEASDPLGSGRLAFGERKRGEDYAGGLGKVVGCEE